VVFFINHTLTNLSLLNFPVNPCHPPSPFPPPPPPFKAMHISVAWLLLNIVAAATVLCCHCVVLSGLCSSDPGEEVCVTYSNALVRINTLDLRSQVRQMCNCWSAVSWSQAFTVTRTRLSCGYKRCVYCPFHTSACFVFPDSNVMILDTSIGYCSVGAHAAAGPGGWPCCSCEHSPTPPHAL
jgi:hypothetical protein